MIKVRRFLTGGRSSADSLHPKLEDQHNDVDLVASVDWQLFVCEECIDVLHTGVFTPFSYK